MEIRTLHTYQNTEYYITGLPDENAATVSSAAQGLFSEIAAIIKEKGIRIIQEKIYGRKDMRNKILNIRKKIFLKHGLDPLLPFTYLDGRPAAGKGLAGIQLWGVCSQKSTVSTLEHSGKTVGRIWSGQGFRMLYIPHIQGIAPDGSLPSGAVRQAECMFTHASSLLRDFGFSYSRVIRTWIYMARILDWYDEFNKVRNTFHSGEKLAVFPASTGIRGRTLNEECFMDILAVDADDDSGFVIEPVSKNACQNAAFLYGSAFSRAMVVTKEGKKTIYVSGTASIDAEGKSIHNGCPEAQIIQTLLVIAAILNEQGGGLENICMATLYCKSEEICDVYKKVISMLGITSFPVISVLADVCRSDLLMEIEAVAII